MTKHKKTGYFAIFSHELSRVTTEDTENFIITRTITDVHGRHVELYVYTNYHECTRTTRRIISSHGQTRMYTDNAEDYIFTRTITDDHGELLNHSSSVSQ